jgi:hypothetical protein
MEYAQQIVLCAPTIEDLFQLAPRSHWIYGCEWRRLMMSLNQRADVDSNEDMGPIRLKRPRRVRTNENFWFVAFPKHQRGRPPPLGVVLGKSILTLSQSMCWALWKQKDMYCGGCYPCRGNRRYLSLVRRLVIFVNGFVFCFDGFKSQSQKSQRWEWRERNRRQSLKNGVPNLLFRNQKRCHCSCSLGLCIPCRKIGH